MKRPDWLLTEPSDVYHAKSAQYMTSHGLRLFARCPRTFHLRQTGQLPQPEDTKAYTIGRAAHVLILEGRQRYEADFAIGGPINPKTGNPYGEQTKAFAEWVEQQAKAVLSDSMAATVEEMAASVRGKFPRFGRLGEGVAEGVVRGELRGVLCQARIDWTDSNTLAELKTCNDLDYFESDLETYGYPQQVVFYASMMPHLPTIGIAAVEKSPPYRCGTWRLSDARVAREQERIFQLLDEYKNNVAAGSWFDRYQEERVIS